MIARPGSGQDTLSQLHDSKRKLRIAALSAGVVYTGSLAGLNYLWYRDSERQPFTLFNDNAEWKQVDKAGHFYSAFHIAAGTASALKSFRVRPTRADLVGSITAFAVLLPIEIFDGHSVDYGASLGDLAANAGGALFFLGQQSLWKETRINPKFSFQYSPYASLRPSLLGTGPERILKDYNGQTYWMSVDIDKFTRFPRWLNIAAGYGAEGMIYARDEQHAPLGYPLPYRQFYLALDPDLTAIRTRSKAIKTLLFFANMIKIPAPALSFDSKGTRFHPLFF